MKRLLIISYYYPPCAKSGAHRAIKMAKYLPNYGWEPYILTAENSRCDRLDNELMQQVIHIKVIRTTEFFPLRNCKAFVARVWRKIWKFLTIIDQHIGWVPFSYQAGLQAIKRHKIHAIFVTGYPFSAFLVGLLLKKRTKLPLFLDYRDPWISNPGFINCLNKEIASRIENICLKNCDLYFGATPAITTEVGKRYLGNIKNKGRTFTFSYDPSELPNIDISKSTNKNKLVLLSVGQVYDYELGDNLISAISQLFNERFISIDNFVFESYGDLRLGLPIKREKKRIIRINTFIPHQEVLKKMLECDGFILPHGSAPLIGICYPGRMFEFFATKKPILYIGPNGIASETIQKAGIGICAHNDVHDIKMGLIEFINKIRNNDFHPNNEFIMQFETKNVIKRFTQDINSIF